MALGHNVGAKLDTLVKRLHFLGAPKILSACVILLALCDNVVIFSEAYSFVELFAGEAWVSRVMRAGGHPTASLDINIGAPLPNKQNAYDLLTDSGFLLALVTVLNIKMDQSLVVIGLLCSSFVAINRGTNRRFPFAPLGDERMSGVQEGNCLTSRTCFDVGDSCNGWNLPTGAAQKLNGSLASPSP